jgi:alkylation response protein AidB-like acyl-CoA dehydrogenase
MATTTTPAGKTQPGGGFLIEAPRPADVFTPAEMTGDQRLIGQAAAEFVAKEVVPLIPDLELHKPGLMPQLLKKAGELGLLGSGVPEAYGGSDLDKISGTLLSEKVSTYASFSVSVGAHSGIGTLPIVYFGTEQQKKKYLPKISTGEWIACYCLSEPQAGSDAQNARTRAVLSPDGKHWMLNGQKMWISNGGFADVFIVFAKVDGEKFSCFIVERGFPGFSVGAEEKKMGLRGSSTAPIFFENCMVPKENLLHEIGRGHIVAFNILNVGRLTLGASCIGGSKTMIETAAKYAKERVAFGHSIGDFGLIRAKLADMAAQTFGLESAVYRAAGMIDRAAKAAEGGGAGSEAGKTQHLMKTLEEYAIECSIGKVYGSETLDFAVDEAVQIFGGYGFHEDYPVARAYRDSRVNRIFEGTNEINRLLIIQMLMKRALSGAVPLLAAGAKLQEEILAGPGFEEAEAGPWTAEERILAGAKKAFLLAAGAAMQKYRERLADQQEIVAALSDIVIQIYVMESALVRAMKTAASPEANPAMAAAARLLIEEGVTQIETSARTAMAASVEGDMLRTQLAVLRRFLKREPADTVALRRVIADAVESQNRYPFN